jgi:flagellar M-ring protein FliF
MFAAVLGLARVATTPGKALLYAGLETSVAGDVVRALEQRDVAYDVRGGAIFVEATKRDELRMTLAAEGLPANGSAGYELLDTLTGFGTTSQMFDAAYWRAKEGELARTIVGSPQIRAARVHISNTSSSPFRRDAKPSASVTVSSAIGHLTTENAKALRFLIASAVAGLTPSNVSVIDADNGRIINTDEAGSDGGVAAIVAADIKSKVERLLEARVGPGNAVVEVSIEKVTERESIVERRFDPEGRVAISTDSEERSTSSEDARGGAVTVASNLPEGDGASDRNSTSQNSETRERVNFEVSETQREIMRAPGAIKRLTVAVLVDGLRQVDDLGAESWAPRPQEELGALRDLVASAVGFNADRGDIITLKSMEFEPVELGEMIVEPSLLDSIDFDLMTLVQLGVLAVVSLLLGFFVVRPILAGRALPALPALGAPVPAPATAAGGQSTVNLALNDAAGSVDGAPPHVMIENGSTSAKAKPGAVVSVAGGGPAPGQVPNTALGHPADTTMPGGRDPVQRLRSLIEERRDDTVEILREWVDERGEPV